MPRFNPLISPIFELKPNQIDLWIIPLHQDLPWADRLLNAEEQHRAQRYYFDKHRRRFRVARTLQRLLLAQYLGEKAAALKFAQHDYGKPYLPAEPSLHFNLSHSGEYALLAVGLKELGVDIERYADRPYQGIAQEVFSLQEKKALIEAPPWQKPWLFFHIWAQKEAFIKANGRGLSYPLKEFNASLTTQPIQIEDPYSQILWQLTPFMPKIMQAAALCHHPEIQECNWMELTLTPSLFERLGAEL